jgi:hypothetical protein
MRLPVRQAEAGNESADWKKGIARKYIENQEGGAKAMHYFIIVYALLSYGFYNT